MLTLLGLGWLISGFVSFFLVIGKIWEALSEIFTVTYDVLKVASVVGMFIFHVLGGLISLGITIYNHFQE
jgi:hypothetical protein